MNNDRFGQTPEQTEDEARHTFAVGTVLLRGIADKLTEIALKGDTFSHRELGHLHDRLFKVYELLGDQTVWSIGDEPATDAAEVALDAYRDTYSDGTPVSIVVGPRVAGAGQRRAIGTTAVSRGIPTWPTPVTSRMGPFLPDAK
jgi:hypothetical protein